LRKRTVIANKSFHAELAVFTALVYDAAFDAVLFSENQKKFWNLKSLLKL